MTNLITKTYQKNLVRRIDKDAWIPYYTAKDFEGLHEEQFTFNNARGIEIHYFFYYYDGYKKDKIILFCPGIGPGHISYFKEIDYLAKSGYKVLTLDYTGCGDSKGEMLGSLNNPTLDAMNLLDLLNLKEEIILVGHSLGAYTALNLVNLRKDITKAVIMSGFITIRGLIKQAVHLNYITNRVMKYERKTVPEFIDLDNIKYLKTTKDKILAIQSSDDNVVSYSIGLKVIEDANNPNIKILKVNNKKHNPNYTEEAVKYMGEVMSKFFKKIKTKGFKSIDEKKDYFKDVSIDKMTEQDDKIYKEILDFIA